MAPRVFAKHETTMPSSQKIEDEFFASACYYSRAVHCDEKRDQNNLLQTSDETPINNWEEEVKTLDDYSANCNKFIPLHTQFACI